MIATILLYALLGFLIGCIIVGVVILVALIIGMKGVHYDLAAGYPGISGAGNSRRQGVETSGKVLPIIPRG